MSNAINFVKDGYIAVIDWRQAHPHGSLLLEVALVVLVLVM